MPAAESPKRPAGKAPGRLSRALLRLLMRRAKIVASDRLADGFKLITLDGPSLKDVLWEPGQKIQIAMGSAFVARTYTPMEWNASTGRTRVLGFEHGDGPGSHWVRGVEPGDECDLFGPRASLDLRRVSGSIALFGDETSVGLAYALIGQDQTRFVTVLLEVGDVDGARLVLKHLNLEGAMLFARRSDGTHLKDMVAALSALVADGAAFVLTGKAATIQQIRQSLKEYAVPSANILSKAYWAPGKAGLD